MCCGPCPGFALGRCTARISFPDSTTGVTEYDYPDVLPGSRRAGNAGVQSVPIIGLIDLATGTVTDLAAGSMARYIAPGYLAIGTGEGRLLAARFDPREGRLIGVPVAMLQDVQEEAGNGTVEFAVSVTGTLLYQRKTGGSGGIFWVDRSGRRTPVDTTMTGGLGNVALSPDGTQIAVTRGDGGGTQVWVKELATGAFSRLSFDVTNADRPVWTPDGRRVAFLATRNNRRTACVRRADGSDSAQAASPGDVQLDEIGFDPLGRYTLFRSQGGGLGTRRLMFVKNGVDSTTRVLLQARFDTFGMGLSPDGQWLAYVSNESGASKSTCAHFPTWTRPDLPFRWRRHGGDVAAGRD
jgi:hypothetical protein